MSVCVCVLLACSAVCNDYVAFWMNQCDCGRRGARVRRLCNTIYNLLFYEYHYKCNGQLVCSQWSRAVSFLSHGIPLIAQSDSQLASVWGQVICVCECYLSTRAPYEALYVCRNVFCFARSVDDRESCWQQKLHSLHTLCSVLLFATMTICDSHPSTRHQYMHNAMSTSCICRLSCHTEIRM